MLIFQDITEERAKEDQDYLGRIMGGAPTEIFFIEPDSLRFSLANGEAQHKLGYGADELKQLTLLDVMPDLAKERAKEILGPLLAGAEKEISFETRIKGQDREYAAKIRLQHLPEEEPPILVALVHDASDGGAHGEA